MIKRAACKMDGGACERDTLFCFLDANIEENRRLGAGKVTIQKRLAAKWAQYLCLTAE